MEKRDIFNSWHCKIPPYISRHLTSKSFVEDSVSELLHILSPPTLRPVFLYTFHGHSLTVLHFHSFSYLLCDVMLQLIDTYKLYLKIVGKTKNLLFTCLIYASSIMSVDLSCNFCLISSWQFLC